jgi:hypothetical protein
LAKKKKRAEKYKLTFSEENAYSSVGENSLLHLETLLVVTAGQSENVPGVLLTHNFTVELLSHLSFVDWATKSSR